MLISYIKNWIKFPCSGHSWVLLCLAYEFFSFDDTMIKITDSLLSKSVLLGLSICMCISLFLDKKLIRIWHQDQQWRQYFRTFIYSFGYVGKENNFPLPF